MSASPLGRRPIRARASFWARALARGLAGRRVAPDVISFVGVGFAVVAAAAFILAEQRDLPLLLLTGGGEPAWLTALGSGPWPMLYLVAAVAIEARLLANLQDGMVAEAGGRASRAGAWLNESLDRLADVVVLVGAGWATQWAFALRDARLVARLALPAPWAMALGGLAALLAVLTAYVRTLGAALGVPGVYAGPMGKAARMHVLAAGCAAAAIEAALGLPPLMLQAALWVIVLGSAVTLVVRAQYIARALAEPRS